METTRRSFMIALGSIPFLGVALPKDDGFKPYPLPGQQTYDNPFLFLLRQVRKQALYNPKFEWPGGYNWAQIFKTEQHGFENPERLARIHDMDIERALWFSTPQEMHMGVEGNVIYRMTRGLFHFLETNKYDYGICDQSRLIKAFTYGNTVKTLFASHMPKNLYKKYGTKQIMHMGGGYKMDILRVCTEHGELNCVLSADQAFKYSAIVDLEYVKLRVFRDCVDYDPTPITADYKVVARVSEVGLQVDDERVHSGILEC